VDLAYASLEESEALLVVGSSLMIFSGYRFCIAAKKQGKPIVAINLGRTRADPDLTFKVELECGRVLSEVTAQLGL
jgi:NAD-dependent SIR2 family protein deacetylase